MEYWSTDVATNHQVTNQQSNLAFKKSQIPGPEVGDVFVTLL